MKSISTDCLQKKFKALPHFIWTPHQLKILSRSKHVNAHFARYINPLCARFLWAQGSIQIQPNVAMCVYCNDFHSHLKCKFAWNVSICPLHWINVHWKSVTVEEADRVILLLLVKWNWLACFWYLLCLSFCQHLFSPIIVYKSAINLMTILPFANHQVAPWQQASWKMKKDREIQKVMIRGGSRES